MARANYEELAVALHTALGEELLRRVKSGSASAQELSVARQFLCDNNVTDLLLKNKPVTELSRILPFPEREQRNVGG